MKQILTTAILLAVSISSFAQRGGFGKEKEGAANPFRLYYYGYNLNQPGIYFGPELDFLWTRHEKVQCETGMKVIDKKLLFIPNIGFIFQTNTAVNLYGGIEVDYQVVYDRGGIVEFFTGIGYTGRFGNGVYPLEQQDFEEILLESSGALMPTFGFGTGYDFYKVGSDLPLKINLRVLTSSIQPTTSFFNPGFQIGFTYGKH
jgi:hypothetical protein